MTEQDYINQIRNSKAEVNVLSNAIEAAYDSIDELNELIARLRKLASSVEEAASGGKRRLLGIVSLLNPMRKRSSFFADTDALYTGRSYQSAKNGIASSISDAQRKINDLEDEIAQNRRRISVLNNNIADYNYALTTLSQCEVG